MTYSVDYLVNYREARNVGRTIATRHIGYLPLERCTYPYDHSKPTAFHGPSPLKRCRSAISANDAHVHHSANHMLRVTYQLRPSNSELSHTFSRLHSIAHSTIRPFEETRGIIFSYFYFGFPDLLLFSN